MSHNQRAALVRFDTACMVSLGSLESAMSSAVQFGFLLVLFVLGSVPASSEARSRSRLEGMWSDPPVTAEGTFCAAFCTDAGLDRLNALLDDPANDTRPSRAVRFSRANASPSSATTRTPRLHDCFFAALSGRTAASFFPRGTERTNAIDDARRQRARERHQPK
jgi:hypothetical protein